MSLATISSDKMRINIIYNYLAQVYLAIAGLLALPFLLQQMGAELYAFVAILFTIQSIFSILDGGLSGSLSREFALCNGGFTNIISARSLFDKSEWIFATISTLAFLSMYASATYLSDDWLKLNEIRQTDSVDYLLLIGAIAAIRLFSALYRAVLMGYERQKKLSIINILITTGRYFLILPLLEIVDNAGMFYFKYQLVLSVIEFIVLRFAATTCLSGSTLRISNAGVVGAHFKMVLKTSSQIWLLTLIWVISNQVDKFLLSRAISLEEFGYFSIVASLSAGMLLLAAPVTSAAMPKLTGLIKEEFHEDATKLYFKVTKIVSMIGFPVALTLVAAPSHALLLFTNDHLVSERFSYVLVFHILGSLLILLSGLTFLLNQAIGDLSKNIRQNLYYLIAIIVLMMVMTASHGIIGAAYAYFAASTMLALIIIKPLNALNGVNFHRKWIYLAIGKPLTLGLPMLALFVTINPGLSSRINSFIWLSIIFICSFGLYSLALAIDQRIIKMR